MVHSSNQHFDLPLWQKIASAGLAGCTADLVTFPLDTVKVWLQVRGENTNSSYKETSTKANTSSKNLLLQRNENIQQFSKRTIGSQAGRFAKNASSVTNKRFYFTSNEAINTMSEPRNKFQLNHENSRELDKLLRPSNVQSQGKEVSHFQSSMRRGNPGLIGTLVQGVRNNGFRSLYGGISAGLQRQAAFCAVRIGLYDSVKASYHKILPGSKGGKQISQRILAGSTTAFVAVALFQPAEVVKIRMQAQTSKAASDRVYSSSIQAYRSIFKVGFREAWKGLETNAARLGVVNVCELVTYDVVKELLLDYKLMKDNPACHFTSAFLSGFVTTVVASPIDVVKTRYMNSKPGCYKGPLHCAKTMLCKEGFRAFYKGFVPAYLRLGSWNIVMFVSYEQYKSLFHRNSRSNVESKQKHYY